MISIGCDAIDRHPWPSLLESFRIRLSLANSECEPSLLPERNLFGPATIWISYSVVKTVTLCESCEDSKPYLHVECALGMRNRTNFAMPQIILKDTLALDSINETALSRGMNEVAKLTMKRNVNVSN